MTTFSIRNEFHSDIASLLLDEIQYQKSAFYYFLGKADPWLPDDVVPDAPESNSAQEDTKIRTNALYFKRISPNEVTLVAKRYDWSSGEIFDAWDHTLDMRSKKFYCFTDEHNVYKCLDNNGGAPSTIKPTGLSFVPIRTADGYLWKYMYTVPNFKRKQFASYKYLPVQRALTDSFYDRGSIENVSIISGGSGYSDVPLTNIVVSGGTTTGAGAVLSIDSFGPAGTITSISVTNGGTGYTAGAKIELTSVNGTGAVINPVIVGGVITDVDIVSGGYAYTTGDLATVVVGGAKFYPVVSRESHSIVEVITLDPGIGYTSAPTLTVVDSMGVPSGLYPGNSGAVLEPILLNGRVDRVLIRDPGVDYSVDTNTTIVVSGDGNGASFSPVVSEGTIIGVVVENPGTAYTNVLLTVVGTGSGASLSATISASDFQSEQSIVEQTSIDGAIHLAIPTVGGEDYTATTEMTIVGDGSGAAGHVLVDNGKIVQIVMDSPGSGYTWAEITFNDPNRVDPLSLKQKAEAYAILPPRGGHGKDAVIELFADTLAISARLQTDEKLNLIDQDFRQFGIVRNPRNLQTGVLFKSPTHLAAFDTAFQSTNGLVLDEILEAGTSSFRVIWFDTERVILQRLSSLFKSPLGELVSKIDPLRTYTCHRIFAQPVLNKYSGNLLYSANQNPFTFAENQGVLVKTFIKL